jgi:hypothetical protein
VLDRVRLELGERETVIWAIANNARDSGRGLVAVNTGWLLECLRCFETDARVIVIKDEGAGVVIVARAVDAEVAGAEVTIRNVFR